MSDIRPVAAPRSSPAIPANSRKTIATTVWRVGCAYGSKHQRGPASAGPHTSGQKNRSVQGCRDPLPDGGDMIVQEEVPAIEQSHLEGSAGDDAPRLQFVPGHRGVVGSADGSDRA